MTTYQHFSIPGYNLESLLGQGGMGEVYLAQRQSSAGVPVPCVVKTIIEYTNDESGVDMQEAFLNEARICSHLRHPNVVSIMDVGKAADRLYITMEWIDGIDALGLIELGKQRKRGMSFNQALFIAHEALKGLHHAHTAVGPEGEPLNIVHRDISPDNILISRQGAVKLADFGVAFGQAASGEGPSSGAGKPSYMAQELWKGGEASVQSDIFAMGATFYELITSKQLFPPQENIFALMMQIDQFDPEQMVEEMLTFPEGIEDIFIRSLAHDPADRYESALEMLEDVNDFCYEAGIRLLDARFANFIERMLEFKEQLKAPTPS